MLNPIIGLITDFGPGSYHVGAMKGVIRKISPSSEIIDICHDISPFNVMEAMYVLDSVQPYFPSPTIFVVVIDPGVGSSRRPLLAIGDNHYYICPDNGVLTRVIASDYVSKVIHIEEEHYILPNPSPTFHARDVFAPCAGWLAKTLGADNFGDPVEDYKVLETPKIKIIADRMIEIPVLFTDHFGNLVTSFEISFLEKARERFPGTSIRIEAGKAVIPGISQYYSQAQQPGDPIAYFGSMNLLEIGLRERNASDELGLKAGSSISIHLGE
ncbi:SAM-dependent chlorinase/fluorinase [bacterium]|nr:SAM-dependent chlorinase/fluorinase [candidate division CSSED10-310 bacterium]